MLLYINDRQICCVYHNVVMLFVLCCSVAESTEKGNKANDQEKPNQAKTVPNVVTSLRFQRVSIVVSVLLLLLLLCIVLIVCLIRFYLREKEKAQALLFSLAMIEEQTTV